MVPYTRPHVRIIPVTAFVDWNSQIHAAAPPREVDDIEVANKTLSYVGGLLSTALPKILSPARFDVSLRLYHGWHRGFEPTPRRKAIVTAAASITTISRNPNVLLRSDVHFGDCLTAAATSRLHMRLNCHIPNTLRKSKKPLEVDEEKMVDTAIACDVVDMAYREPDRWLIILGEDDDLIPPLIAADGIRGPNSGRVLMIRDRSDGPYFKIQDIRVSP